MDLPKSENRVCELFKKLKWIMTAYSSDINTTRQQDAVYHQQRNCSKS
jgi:hypothetical protein